MHPARGRSLPKWAPHLLSLIRTRASQMNSHHHGIPLLTHQQDPLSSLTRSLSPGFNWSDVLHCAPPQWLCRSPLWWWMEPWVVIRSQAEWASLGEPQTSEDEWNHDSLWRLAPSEGALAGTWFVVGGYYAAPTGRERTGGGGVGGVHREDQTFETQPGMSLPVKESGEWTILHFFTGGPEAVENNTHTLVAFGYLIIHNTTQMQ